MPKRKFDTPAQLATIERIRIYLATAQPATASAVAAHIGFKPASVREYLTHMREAKMIRRLDQSRSGQHGLAEGLWLLGAAPPVPFVHSDPLLAWIPRHDQRDFSRP